MLSVIIPTVQKKLEVLKTLVGILEQDSSVSEIFIINNKPDIPLNLSGSKLKIYTPEENLYVNPSWNLGVSKIQNDIFVLMNDDLLVCNDFCKTIVESDVFNNEKTGLVGVSPTAINQFANVDYIAIPAFPQISKPEFKPLNRYLATGDWGVAIFGRKQNYYKIPDDLKIIYGDNYLLYQNVQNNKQNFSVVNLPVNHIHSSSSASREFSSVVVNDIRNSKKYFYPESVNSAVKEEEYEIEHKGNVCIIRFLQNKASMCLKYRDDKGLYEDNIISRQLLALMPKLSPDLAAKITASIKSGRNKSC